jgi:hypothetical protein
MIIVPCAVLMARIITLPSLYVILASKNIQNIDAVVLSSVFKIISKDAMPILNLNLK